MNLVFKLHVIRKPARAGNPAYLQWPEQDAFPALDRHLAASGMTGSELFRRRVRYHCLYENLPWVTLIWPQGLPLSAHFAELRYMRQNFALSNPSLWRGMPLDDAQIDTLQIVDFWRKPVMADIAARSPAIASAWQALKDIPPTGFWLCLADPPDPQWVAEAARDNLPRYHKIAFAKRPPPAFNPVILLTPVDQWRYSTAQALHGVIRADSVTA